MSQFFEYTDNGLKFSGFQDVKGELSEAWKATFGSDIDLSPTSPDGLHVALEAATVTSVGEMLQTVADTFSRERATGVFLDYLAALMGLNRYDDETDAELRKRMDYADNSGLATYDGMLTYLRNVIDKNVGLYVNDEPTTNNDGVPGHSFRVVVPDTNTRTSNEIAKAIWNCKPAGIKADGNQSGVAVDLYGFTHNVKYSVPTALDIDVKIVLTLYTEERTPATVTSDVEAEVRSWGLKEYTPGKDVLVARLFTPIMAVNGIAGAEISVKKHSESTWTTDNIGVQSQQYVHLSDVNVTVSAG